MSYTSINEMATSPSLLARITACAADEGEADPAAWARANVWHVVSQPGWADAWDYARDTATDDVNPDTGLRPGVVNDGMILAAVQALRTP